MVSKFDQKINEVMNGVSSVQTIAEAKKKALIRRHAKKSRKQNAELYRRLSD